MSDDQQHELDPELLEPVTQFVVRSIKPQLFAVPGDHPAPEQEIREALRCGGGFIALREDKNSFLVVTHRNGHVLVHLARIRSVIHNAAALTGIWEDSAQLDEHRWLIGLDAVGILAELDSASTGLSLRELCYWSHKDEVLLGDNAPRIKVTVLDMERIDIHTFMEGLTEPRELAAAA